MFRSHAQAVMSILQGKNLAGTLILIFCNLAFNVLANTGFKYSAISPNWRGFLTWQVVGNLAGFVTVLTLTGLLRFIPMHVAYPVTAGLSVIGVQVIAARILFHESITPAQWWGTLFVVVGILLIGGR